MRYKLITLNKNTTRMPILNLSLQNTELTYGGPEVPIVAQSSNAGDTSFTFELNDTDVAYIIPVIGGEAILSGVLQEMVVIVNLGTP